MLKKILYAVTALILICLLIESFANNKSWVVKFYIKKGENQSRALIYINGNKMKIISENNTYIYDCETKKITLINTNKKIYWSGTVKDFSKAVTQMKIREDRHLLTNNHSFLKNLDTDKRNYFNHLIDQRTGYNPLISDYSIFNKFNIKSTPNFTSVGEYVVRKYEVLISGKVMEEIWIAENLLSHMGWDMHQYKNFLNAFFFHSNIAPYFNLNAYIKVRKNGLPLKVIIFHTKEKTEITMDHASKISLTKDSFCIPTNFKLKPINEVL